MYKDYIRLLDLNTNQPNMRIIKSGGKVVSHVVLTIREVSLGGIITSVGRIGAVATDEKERGKGLASILVKDALDRAAEQNATAVIISGDRGLYHRFNAIPCGRVPNFSIQHLDEFKKKANNTHNITLRRATVADVDTIIKVYSNQQIRYILPKEDFVAVFNGAKVFDKDAEWWLVCSHDVIGVAAVYKEDTLLKLLEWAGHVDALEAAVPQWLEHYKPNSFIYVAPDKSYLPVSWWEFIGEYSHVDGTVVIVNAKKLLEQCKTRFFEKMTEHEVRQLHITATHTAAKFEYNGESVEFKDAKELGYFFFGSSEKHILDDKLPTNSELHKLLSRFFPLPLPCPGVGFA